MEVDVLCIGHAAYDLSMLVPSYPAENSKLEIQQLHECGGGPAANAACLLGRWGVNATFAGLVGDDIYGQKIKREFEQNKVETSLLEVRVGHVTPFSVIIVNAANGSRTIINRKSNAPEFHLRLPPVQPKPKVFLVDGHELAASLQALEQFPYATSILDAGSWREGTARLAQEVDYLVASERFAKRASGLAELATPDAQRKCIDTLRSRFETKVVVTLGENGLIADNDGELLCLPAFPARAVDTTGAGDVFHGAFAYCLLKGLGFTETLRFSSMAASLSVRRFGGRSSIPELREVEEALSHAE